MTNKEARKAAEIVGMLKAQVTIARNDADRAETTSPQMESDYFRGYYRAEVTQHRRYARKFERILVEVEQLLKGGNDD